MNDGGWLRAEGGWSEVVPYSTHTNPELLGFNPHTTDTYLSFSYKHES